MFVEDEPQTAADPDGPVPELLEDSESQHVRLLGQRHELERLRDQVRGTAEREAAAIVTAARQDVRRVLMDARRKLLVLVAQLQAVGCDTQGTDLPVDVVEGEATTHTQAARQPDLYEKTHKIVSGVRRDVREVLLEARSELQSLSTEARELRAKTSRLHDAGRYPSTPQGGPRKDRPVPIDAAPRVGAPLTHFGASPPRYTSIGSSPRVWIACAAAFALVAVGALLLFSSGRQRSTEEAAGASAKAAQGPAPAGSAARAATSSDLSLVIDVRRPSWIRTTVDGNADRGRVFSTGHTSKLVAKRDIVIRAGDAGAVFVSVNGGPASPLGPDRQAVTRRFATREAVTLAPAVSPSPRGAPSPTAGVVSASPAGAPSSRLSPSNLPAPTRASQSPSRTNVGTAAAPASKDPAPTRASQNPSRTNVGTAGRVAATPGALPPQLPDKASQGKPSDAEREILRATRRWFESYFGGDRPGMAELATEDFSIDDLRDVKQRVPAATRDVDRIMEQVRIELATDVAVLNARLTERATVSGQPKEWVSLVSGVWIRRDGRWRLLGMRFYDPATAGR